MCTRASLLHTIALPFAAPLNMQQSPVIYSAVQSAKEPSYWHLQTSCVQCTQERLCYTQKSPVIYSALLYAKEPGHTQKSPVMSLSFAEPFDLQMRVFTCNKTLACAQQSPGVCTKVKPMLTKHSCITYLYTHETLYVYTRSYTKLNCIHSGMCATEPWRLH